LVLSAPAWAAELKGTVYCDENGNKVFDCWDRPLAGVVVTLTSQTTQLEYTGTTGTNGFYCVKVPYHYDTYVATLDENTIPAGAKVIWPTCDYAKGALWGCDSVCLNWLLDCHKEDELHCWLTGGGVKFHELANGTVARGGPEHSMGGNIAPSCSLKPGDGGNWNHIAHDEGLHFQGKVVTKVVCGNVGGDVPDGSESPKTGVNFIKAWGRGTLKGIKGNKTNYDEVHFFLYCEDLNEPGSHGAKDGELVDRYFLRVYTDLANPVDSTVLLVDVDGDKTTFDPITITGGNLQIHASSCDDPPTDAFFAVQAGSTTKGNNGKKK
jgi:hypothetical protein